MAEQNNPFFGYARSPESGRFGARQEAHTMHEGPPWPLLPHEVPTLMTLTRGNITRQMGLIAHGAPSQAARATSLFVFLPNGSKTPIEQGQQTPYTHRGGVNIAIGSTERKPNDQGQIDLREPAFPANVVNLQYLYRSGDGTYQVTVDEQARHNGVQVFLEDMQSIASEGSFINPYEWRYARASDINFPFVRMGDTTVWVEQRGERHNLHTVTTREHQPYTHHVHEVDREGVFTLGTGTNDNHDIVVQDPGFQSNLSIVIEGSTVCFRNSPSEGTGQSIPPFAAGVASQNAFKRYAELPLTPKNEISMRPQSSQIPETLDWAYQLLGLPAGGDLASAEKAYRERLQTWNPDNQGKSGDTAAKAKYERLQRAMELVRGNFGISKELHEILNKIPPYDPNSKD